ncbi:MAG TPA: NYN domain-containing protein [bacterium]|nr:MAG: NYN domain protein [Parcubacteria group bacterium ADurb.Bin192]HPN14625.1 NYN domain-containing protein [bacterium]
MIKSSNNVAYIDGANLHKGIEQLGWSLDYGKFRVWLSEKHGVKKAYIFIGLLAKNSSLYTYLQECGFVLIFKETIYDGDGKPKGNCDADLVLSATIDVFESNYDTVILVSSDGDYAPLVRFLQKKGKMGIILSPSNAKKCSILLKRTNAKITFLDQMKLVLSQYNEKAPGKDGTLEGSFS